MPEIVVVDPSEEFVELFKFIFRDDNIVIRGCHSLTTYLPQLQEDSPDLLILDVFGFHPYEKPVLETLRQRWKSLPILITSTAPAQLEHLDWYGANDGLEKPFDLAEMKHKVYKLLGLN